MRPEDFNDDFANTHNGMYYVSVWGSNNTGTILSSPLGINDIGRYEDVANIFSNYKNIISILTENNITPYVQSTLLTSINDYNLKVIELNILLKKYCEDNGIQFIDLNKELSKDNRIIEEYTGDGVHLNAKGYQIWKAHLNH